MSRACLFPIAIIILIGCKIGLSPVGSVADDNSQAILGKQWQWVSTITPTEKLTVKNPQNYTILFQPEGKAQIQFDCNKGHGSFEISNHKLYFGLMASTRMACPTGSLDMKFSEGLHSVTAYYIKNGNLYLEFSDNSGTMKFKSD